MRNAIQTLWETEELAVEMGKAGRKFLEENYDYDKVVAGITDYLSTLWHDAQ